MELLGWKSVETSGGVAIRIFPLRVFGLDLFGLCKIQRSRVLSASDLQEIEGICREHKCLFIKIELGLGQDLGVFEECGFVRSQAPLVPPSTIYIDLTRDEADLWGSLSKSGKYGVRRAGREGSRVEFYRNPDLGWQRKYYDLILKPTGRRKGFYVPPFKEMQGRVKVWGDKSVLAVVYDGAGKLCGAKFFLAVGDDNGGDGETVLFATGGATTAGRRNKTGYDLLWQSILYFKGLGYKYLDLEGKTDARYPRFTKKWEGFSKFKEKFGGVAVEFPLVQIKYLSPVLKIIDKLLPTGL